MAGAVPERSGRISGEVKRCRGLIAPSDDYESAPDNAAFTIDECIGFLGGHTVQINVTGRLSGSHLSNSVLHRASSIVGYFTILVVSIQALGANALYTPEALAAALDAGRAQVSNLQMEYVLEERTYDDRWNPTSLMKIHGSYSARFVDGWEYFDVKEESKDASGTLRVTRDYWTSFHDGKTRTLLRGNRNSQGYLRGLVERGKRDNYFLHQRYSPHKLIWQWGDSSYSSLLTREGVQVRIEPNSEQVGGVDTVQAVVQPAGATIRLWIAPDRGFLILKSSCVKDADGTVLTAQLLDDLVQLSNGSWYPKKIVVHWGNPEKFDRLVEIRSVSADPVPEAVFKPAFPQDTKVADGVLEMTYYVDAIQQFRQTPGHLGTADTQRELDASLAVADKEAAAARRSDNQVGSAASNGGNRGIGLIAAVACSIMLLGLVWIWRRNRVVPRDMRRPEP